MRFIIFFLTVASASSYANPALTCKLIVQNIDLDKNEVLYGSVKTINTFPYGVGYVPDGLNLTLDFSVNGSVAEAYLSLIEAPPKQKVIFEKQITRWVHDPDRVTLIFSAVGTTTVAPWPGGKLIPVMWAVQAQCGTGYSATIN